MSNLVVCYLHSNQEGWKISAHNDIKPAKNISAETQSPSQLQNHLQAVSSLKNWRELVSGKNHEGTECFCSYPLPTHIGHWYLLPDSSYLSWISDSLKAEQNISKINQSSKFALTVTWVCKQNTSSLLFKTDLTSLKAPTPWTIEEEDGISLSNLLILA